MDEFEHDTEDSDVRRGYVARERTCLMCGEVFESSWAGHRICGKCKSQSRWRRGGASLSD